MNLYNAMKWDYFWYDAYETIASQYVYTMSGGLAATNELYYFGFGEGYEINSPWVQLWAYKDSQDNSGLLTLPVLRWQYPLVVFHANSTYVYETLGYDNLVSGSTSGGYLYYPNTWQYLLYTQPISGNAAWAISRMSYGYYNYQFSTSPYVSLYPAAARNGFEFGGWEYRSGFDLSDTSSYYTGDWQSNEYTLFSGSSAQSWDLSPNSSDLANNYISLYAIWNPVQTDGDMKFSMLFESDIDEDLYTDIIADMPSFSFDVRFKT